MSKNEKLHWRVKKIMSDLPNLDFGDMQDLDIILKTFDEIVIVTKTWKQRAGHYHIVELIKRMRI